MQLLGQGSAPLVPLSALVPPFPSGGGYGVCIPGGAAHQTPPRAFLRPRPGPNLILHVDKAHLDAMGDWCQKQHGESGLTGACQASNIRLEQAEVHLHLQTHPFRALGLRTPIPGALGLSASSAGLTAARIAPQWNPQLSGHWRVVEVQWGGGAHL